MTARCLERLGCKRDMSIFQSTNRYIEILDLESSACSLIGRLPSVAHVCDGERVTPNVVLDPASAHHFILDFQAKHLLVKQTCPLDVCDRNCDESNSFDFHFATAAFTTFCAASARSSAVITGRPDSAINFLPNSTFVPSRRTTSGTDSFTVLAALMMPCAMTSHFMMPPNMLTRIAFTFLSAIKILNASVTCSSVAPPPTSRKLAGSPP